MKSEVKNAQNEQVDWTKIPQLVEFIEENNSLIVLCIDAQNVDTFKGVILSDTSCIKRAVEGKEYADFWKCNFKPFQGSITLSND